MDSVHDRYMAYPPRDERDAGYLGSRAGRAGQQQSSYLKVKIDGWPIPKSRLVKGPYKQIYRDGSPSTFQLLYILYMGVSKNRGVSPKMDGENNGKPYQNGVIWGETHYFRKHPH